MQILIVEDEPRAARQLHTLLLAVAADFQLLAIIDSVEDAVAWFKTNHQPDLVFMDIQLADGLSFEIFQKVTVESPIIFTTAFDQYAIQAFKVNSVDYLLKPIKKEDLNAAMSKFQKSKKANTVDINLLKQLLASVQAPAQRSGILVRQGASFVQKKLTDFQYFYSDEGVTFGVSANSRFIIDETIDQLMETLPNSQFFRINRGQIVSKQAVVKFEPYFNHRAKLVVLHPRDQEFIVSRPKTSDFKVWMNS